MNEQFCTSLLFQMMRYFTTLFFSSLLFICVDSRAQMQKFSGWFQAQQDIQLNRKLSFQIENQFRTDNHWKNAEVLETRIGLTYDATPSISFASGYSFIENWTTYKGIHDHVAEHRIWTQMSKDYGGPLSIFRQRVRLEERILPILAIQNAKFIRTGNDLSTRVRYQIRWTRNFPKTPGTELGFYTVLNNEIFINATGASHINNKALDQIRAFAGFGYRFRENLNIEPGYLFQYVIGKNTSYTENNVFQLSLNMGL